MSPAHGRHPREPSAVGGILPLAPQLPQVAVSTGQTVTRSTQVTHTTSQRPTEYQSSAGERSSPAEPHSWQWKSRHAEPDGCGEAGLSPQCLLSAARSASRWRAQRTVLGVPRRQPRSEHFTPSRRKAHTRLEPPASASLARRAWKRGTSRTVSALDQECHCARRSQLLRWAASWRARVEGRHALIEEGQVC